MNEFSNNKLNAFSRSQLLLGKEGMDRLEQAKVAIFGIGGVGGYVAEALARTAVPIKLVKSISIHFILNKYNKAILLIST